MSHLTDRVVTNVVIVPQAAGGGDPDSSRVDMLGADVGNIPFDSVRFICFIGTITSTGIVTMVGKQAATDIVGDALTGATVASDEDSDSDKNLILDIVRPSDRYVGVTITRSVANSEINLVIAERYNSREVPVTQATMAATAVTLVSPAEA